MPTRLLFLLTLSWLRFTVTMLLFFVGASLSFGLRWGGAVLIVFGVVLLISNGGSRGSAKRTN